MFPSALEFGKRRPARGPDDAPHRTGRTGNASGSSKCGFEPVSMCRLVYNTLTRAEVPHALPTTRPHPDRCLRHSRLPRVGFPGFNRYYEAADTTSVCLCNFALSHGARYLGSPAVFATGRPRGRWTWFLTLVHRSEPFRLFPRRQEALPASRETLYCSALLPSDPGRTSAPDLNGASVLPTFSLQRRLHRYNPIRSSITRLCSSLPTFEGAVSGRQPRLASGCRSGFAGRVGSRRASVETFVRLFAIIVSLFLV
jgi:hypothetical protein